MNLWFVFAGCLFIFSPAVSLVDILPDFFGILLIMRGINKLSDINGRVLTSYKKFGYAAWVALFELACMICGDVFDAPMKVTLSFVFGVLECIFLIPAITELFEGLSYLSLKEADVDIDCDKPRILACVLVILRAAGAFVPGMAVMLSATATGNVESSFVSAERLGIILNVLFCAALLALDIVFCVIFGKFVSAQNKSERFLPRMRELYSERILSNEKLVLSRKISKLSSCMFYASLALLTLKFEGRFVTPEFLAGIIILCGYFLCGQYGKNKKMRYTAALFALIYAMRYAAMWMYSEQFDGVYLPYEESGFLVYYLPVAVLCVAGCVLMMLAGKDVCSVLQSMTGDFTDICYERTDEYREKVANEKKKSLKKKITGVKAAIYAYAVLSATALLAVPVFEISWIFRLIAGIVFAIFIYAVMSNISGEAENAL
ncbi:MAG: hypothetical protein KBS59_04570 [Clostridiales bacterium]|nr:hypothetical protein [Clostridiales bacterium]